jgi:L,D-peptidoglycan transpeptidase YkuD (ErfK/YbiS/YcfS/YnhG family)
MERPVYPPRFGASTREGLVWPGGRAVCVFGRGGLLPAEHKRESDGATPIGAWPFRRVYFRPDRLAAPETGLPVEAIRPDLGWCDDPASPLYNRPVDLPFSASYERMWRDDHVYDVVVALGHNDDPIIPGMGSAIFLHVSQPDGRPTEGCVACALPDLLALLKTAQPGDALSILR